ncbi:Alpha-agarase [BD1-7 clade bacterium]|uniref:Alpha-agarase n=1 Tax=BD1-7 clade bacterium TaxID=2029982 RepID=A0A5S9QXU9_9GAMM|nr:Alpha-agarase [BD1-7 clade bacterium]
MPKLILSIIFLTLTITGCSGGGKSNEKDSDGDGIPDKIDVFPNDSSESKDTDRDGVGDNQDAFPNDKKEQFDSDLDGIGNNSDQFPNDKNESIDSDADGVGDNSDAFPNNKDEQKDSDQDGVGDNTDVFPNDSSESLDSDGDNVGDNKDAFPNDANESLDSDGDGVGNNEDQLPFDPTETKDSDSDGTGDSKDQFPLDSSETIDSDGDGVGDNGDAFPHDDSESKDSDADGVGDNTDEFPEDPAESVDTDGDGVGDNSDQYPTNPDESKDSDGDGVGDNEDQLPLDPNETVDSDNDGTGDNSDIDFDNDGLIEISSIEQLDWIRNSLNGSALIDNDGNSREDGCGGVSGCFGYELNTDLDLDNDGESGLTPADSFYNDGHGWEPIGTQSEPYTGAFDGNGYEITGININREEQSYLGLFGNIHDHSKTRFFRNVSLRGTVVGESALGLVSGKIEGLKNISGVTIYASINGVSSLGGIAGSIVDVNSITSNSYSVSIHANRSVAGGIAGLASDIVEVTNLIGRGSVSTTRGGSIGGIFGAAHDIQNLSKNEISCTVRATTLDASEHAGILFGRGTNIDQINANKMSGEVRMYGMVGGLAGKINYSSHIKHNEIDVEVYAGADGQNGGGYGAGGLAGGAHNIASIEQNSISSKINNPGTYTGGIAGWGSTIDEIENNIIDTTITSEDYRYSTSRRNGGITGGLFGNAYKIGSIKFNLIGASIRTDVEARAIIYRVESGYPPIYQNYMIPSYPTPASDIRYIGETEERSPQVFRLSSTELKCPTNPGDADCAKQGLIIFKDWDETIWDFGNLNTLPVLRTDIGSDD